MALLMKPEPFSREIDRVFDAFFGQNEQQARRWVPPMDLVEAEDHFVLKADLPGLREGDVNIEVQDGNPPPPQRQHPDARRIVLRLGGGRLETKGNVRDATIVVLLTPGGRRPSLPEVVPLAKWGGD